MLRLRAERRGFGTHLRRLRHCPFFPSEIGCSLGRTATRGNIEKRHFDKQFKRKIMKLSELARQIEAHIAENGDVEVRTIDFSDECHGGTREPVFEVEDYCNVKVITL